MFLELFLISAMLMLSFTLGFILSKRYNNTSKQIKVIDSVYEKEQKKKQRGLENIMSYDISVALGTHEQRGE